jgi:predicted RNase H-like HicB family nuclease
MKFHIYMQFEKDTGWYVVTCPAMPGCVSQGRTEKEAIDNIREAILGWLEVEDEKAMTAARNQGTEGKELAVAI